MNVITKTEARTRDLLHARTCDSQLNIAQVVQEVVDDEEMVQEEIDRLTQYV